MTVNGPQSSVSVTENNGSRGASIQISLLNGTGGQLFQILLVGKRVTIYVPGVVYVWAPFGGVSATIF